MKLVSWNVNGIRSARQKGLLDFIVRQKPDILCLQETKAQPERLKENERTFSGYEILFSSAKKPGYSGVATLYRNRLPPSRAVPGIGIAKYDEEGRFLLTDHGDFLLCNAYFPSGTTGEVRQAFKYRFLDDFLNYLKTLPPRDFDRLIICGDFNICHRDIDIHHPAEAAKRQLSGFLPDERKWLDDFIAAGFVDAFRLIHGDKPGQYSWWSFRAGSRGKNLGWRIDYFMVSTKLASRVKDAAILQAVKGSDHCPLVLVLD